MEVFVGKVPYKRRFIAGKPSVMCVCVYIYIIYIIMKHPSAIFDCQRVFERIHWDQMTSMCSTSDEPLRRWWSFNMGLRLPTKKDSLVFPTRLGQWRRTRCCFINLWTSTRIDQGCPIGRSHVILRFWAIYRPYLFRCFVIPTGSLCMPYMVTFTINIPQMLAYIYIYIYHTCILWDWATHVLCTGWTSLDVKIGCAPMISIKIAK